MTGVVSSSPGSQRSLAELGTGRLTGLVGKDPGPQELSSVGPDSRGRETLTIETILNMLLPRKGDREGDMGDPGGRA